MTAIFVTSIFAVFLALTFVAWRRYLWAAESPVPADTCPYSLTEVFGENHLLNVPHQKGTVWLSDVFSRSARKFPGHTALQIPHTGESLTFAELNAQAEKIAAALAPFLTGPDQVVAVAMSQDNAEIVASHLGVLKAGGTLMFLDAALPEALITHMLNDAQPVVILTRGQTQFRDLPTVDTLELPESAPRTTRPKWLDDPTQRLATIFYTSGTTGMPKGVESTHAGYVNLVLTYADYFDLIAGVDATSLTSSLGYDGSISEMYSAWVSGCAVVMLTKEQVRSGPDLVPILCEAEVTVLFCPPVLLTTLTPTPEIDLPYPLCRYIVPAGEAFPPALVEPWTRARRQIINTYGPTEASTDTSRQSLRPGEPITIGSPLPNVTYVILEIDQLTPLPHGEIGELCIGGVHVARGYRNLPEQTAQKFIDHPQFGRLYRTGDKCRIDIRAQRVHFLGRIDAQMKVRGHRVEAQAVEDILQSQFSEIEAAVLDYQNEELVAFVAAPSIREGDIAAVAPAPVEWATRVTESLSRQLPEPSVPTRVFLVDRFVMKPVSGKIDRTCLPDLSRMLKNGETRIVRESTNGEIKSFIKDAEIDPECEEVLEICRDVFETPLGMDDEFALAGGHSIAIARLAQRLQASGRSVSVRELLSDCNTARLVGKRPRKLKEEPQAAAAALNSDENIAERDEAAAAVLSVRYFTTLQILFVGLLYAPVFLAFLIVFGVTDFEAAFAATLLWGLIQVGTIIYIIALAFPFMNLFWVMMIKSFIGGDNYKNNVTPGVYPKWSKMHLRVWAIGKMESMVLLPMGTVYRSAPLMAFALRQLGATVGKNLQCAPYIVMSGPLDLFTIGDDVAIQTGAYIQATRWSGQDLHVGPVNLKSGCKVGMRSAVACNVTVGEGTWITPFTPILNNVGSHEIWEGAPARLNGRCTELKRTADACRHKLPVWMLESVNILIQTLVFFALSVVPSALIFWMVRAFVFAGEAEFSDLYFKATPLFEIGWRLALDAFITAWLVIVSTSLLGCLFIRFTATSPGLFSSRGVKGALLMYRMKMMYGIQRLWGWTLTGQYLRALAGMRFPRVGASECDLMFNLVPEAASATSQVFWSNGCFTNMLDYGAEHIKLRQLDMPRNFFAGNNSVAEYGHLPTNFLLGVSTPASDIQYRRQMLSRDGEPTTIAGNPPIRFASTASGSEDRSGDLPGFRIFLTRIFLNDLLSIGTIPIAEGLVFALAYVCLLRLGVYPIGCVILGLILTQVILLVLCISIKKMMVGREWGADHSTPFWSWRHFAYFFAQDCFFVWCWGLMGIVAGTVLANPVLRWLGCRIGRRTIIVEPMQCFDWNAVSFGNDCVVNGFLQYHTFEDMMLKVKRTHIEDGCAVNIGATVMGGAVIERDTTLLPLSLVLKEMKMSPATYQGSPAEITVDTGPAPRPAEPARVESIPTEVDNTDWLKTAAIIFVLIDHFGYFFMENDLWWAAFGRFAAPVFFFLVGFAKSRSVPLHWIGLGLFLTLLDSLNADWAWVAPNILLSFAIIRIARPFVERLALRFPWITFAVMVAGLIAAIPLAANLVDYGAEGWLWALLGLYHSLYVAGRAAAAGTDQQVSPSITEAYTRNANLIRLLICVAAAIVYVTQEQKEFSFPPAHYNLFIVGTIIMSIGLCLFFRGRSRIQPPQAIANVLGFVGRHTLEIYAVQLAVSEIIVKLLPNLAQN